MIRYKILIIVVIKGLDEEVGLSLSLFNIKGIKNFIIGVSIIII